MVPMSTKGMNILESTNQNENKKLNGEGSPSPHNCGYTHNFSSL